MQLGDPLTSFDTYFRVFFSFGKKTCGKTHQNLIPFCSLFRCWDNGFRPWSDAMRSKLENRRVVKQGAGERGKRLTLPTYLTFGTWKSIVDFSILYYQLGWLVVPGQVMNPPKRHRVSKVTCRWSPQEKGIKYRVPYPIAIWHCTCHEKMESSRIFNKIIYPSKHDWTSTISPNPRVCSTPSCNMTSILHQDVDAVLGHWEAINLLGRILWIGSFSMARMVGDGRRRPGTTAVCEDLFRFFRISDV